MPLSAGTKLGPYEIVAPLGAGGMGEVYRARDTRLDRTVAVKILPSHLSDKPEAKERFEREARAISSLNHPNICHLYDVGEQDGTSYLVMEYLEGETLADRLGKGPLPLPQVLKTGVEICDGLEKAHRSGVVHRDLKPGNIMLTKTGAKLMDFGLAKATADLPPSSSLSMTMSHHSSKPLTAQGTLVGTFQYMSPEQVEGKDADARSDIFALGAVLYEMVTGQHAFSGKSQASIIAAILAAEPPSVSTLQPMSPPALERLIQSCLVKDPDERLQTAHDVKLQLKWIAEGGSQAGVAAPVVVRRKSRERVAWAVAVVGLLLAAAIGFLYWRTPHPVARAVRSTILPPDKATFVFLGPTHSAALSPDGSSVAFVARSEGVSRLWIRPLDSYTARVLPDTEDASAVFWSPDSRNLGFFSQGKLKRVSAGGGPSVTICETGPTRGGSWSAHDVIIFGRYPGEIYQVPASGGTPTKAVSFDPSRHDTSDRWPLFLPDGKHFLYMASPFGSVTEDNAVFVASLDDKLNRQVFRGSTNVAYANGYLLYAVEKTLMARPFDTSKLDFTGDAIPVADGMQYDPIYSNAVFSVSDNGVLLYQTGKASSARTMALFDAGGKPMGTVGDPAAYFYPRFSPDGRRLAYSLIDPHTGKADIWTIDLASNSRTRLTVDPGRSMFPVWSHDGNRLAFASSRPGRTQVFIKQSNGMGTEEKLGGASGMSTNPSDWTPDGSAVIARQRVETTGKWRLVIMPADGSEPKVLLENPAASVSEGRLSPDGHWLAYHCNESGKDEVYVSPYPQPVGRLQISTAGGRDPRWRGDGKELYYVAQDGKVMAAELKQPGGSLQVSSLRALFSTRISTINDTFDVTADGKKFVVSTIATEETPDPLSLVVNWTAELKK